MSELIKQKQKLEVQMHQLESKRQKLGIEISKLQRQIWEISNQIQSECFHKNLRIANLIVTHFKCDDCGAFLICNRDINYTDSELNE